MSVHVRERFWHPHPFRSVFDRSSVDASPKPVTTVLVDGIKKKLSESLGWSLVPFFSQWILQSPDRSAQKERSSKEKAWFNLGNSFLPYYLIFMRSAGSLSGRRCWQWHHYYLFNFVFSLLTRLQTPLSVHLTCMFTTLSLR